MARRLYLESSGNVPPVSPPFSAEWDVVSSAQRKHTYTWRERTAFGTFGSGAETLTTAHNRLAFQFVTLPLFGDQTIDGTFKSIIRVAESVAAADMRAQVRIKVVSRDGLTERGVLLEVDNSAIASEYSTTYTSRKFPKAWTSPGATLTPVNALHGDRVVIEIGTRVHNVVATSYSDGMEIGSFSATERAEDETTTTAGLTPWMEFSKDILFDAETIVGTVSSQMVITAKGPARVGAAKAQFVITAKGPARVGAASVQTVLTEFPAGTQPRFGASLIRTSGADPLPGGIDFPFWLRGDDLEYAEGNHINAWNNRGSGGDTYDALSLGSGPDMRYQGINGHKAAGYQAGGKNLQSPWPGNQRPVSEFVVVYPENFDSLQLLLGVPSGANRLWRINTGSPAPMEIDRFATTVRGVSGAAVTPGPQVLGYTDTAGGAIKFFRNGVAVGTASHSTAYVGVTNTYIGAPSVSGTPAFTGMLAEVLGIPAALSDAQAIAVCGDLMAYYGIS